MTASIGKSSYTETVLLACGSFESEQNKSDLSSKTSSWILSPGLDLFFACGGLVWLLFLVHYFLLGAGRSGEFAIALLGLSSLGAVFLAEVHSAATIIHTYRKPELLNAFPLQSKILPALLLPVAVLGSFYAPITPVLVKIYLLLVPHHFMAQSYGIARVYCLKNNYELNSEERFSMLMLTCSTTFYAVSKQLAANQTGTATFLGQSVPPWGILPQGFVDASLLFLIASAINFVTHLSIRFFKSGDLFPFSAFLTMLTGIAAFTLNPTASGIYWLYVSAFFHATQYLLIVLSVDWKEQNKRSGTERLKSLLSNSSSSRLLGCFLLLSLGIYFGLPGILVNLGANYTLCSAAIFVCVNIHHIVLDGEIWKLRSEKIRQSVSA
ncbi:MAG: hypothetical protein K2X27_26220 [Candidatus Obscuribacterales bacterium]|nr:hypothetical protein [Candidatus Obscuribacterales bacterium]